MRQRSRRGGGRRGKRSPSSKSLHVLRLDRGGVARTQSPFVEHRAIGIGVSPIAARSSSLRDSRTMASCSISFCLPACSRGSHERPAKGAISTARPTFAQYRVLRALVYSAWGRRVTHGSARNHLAR